MGPIECGRVLRENPAGRPTGRAAVFGIIACQAPCRLVLWHPLCWIRPIGSPAAPGVAALEAEAADRRQRGDAAEQRFFDKPSHSVLLSRCAPLDVAGGQINAVTLERMSSSCRTNSDFDCMRCAATR